MAQLVWGARTERFFEAGVDQGVLYPLDGIGVAWSGLISVTESPRGGLPRPYYLDGVKYLNLASAEEFDATIVSYGAPAEFGPSDGVIPIHNGLFATQQPRKTFGLSYRTKVGNDISSDLGYKIHLVYGALAAPATRAHTTLSDSSDPMQMSWAITTLPPSVAAVKRTAHFVVDSRYADPSDLTALEDFLYGTEGESPQLPTPNQLIAIFFHEALVVADIAQAQTVDNLVLTQHQVLTVADAAQTQTIDNLTLTPN